MTNSQVLYSATVAPSSWMKSNTGKIKVGNNSDLVRIAKNPLEDIKTLKLLNMCFLINIGLIKPIPLLFLKL
jgi:imidazolonepropionase-like amidohydrolase